MSKLRIIDSELAVDFVGLGGTKFPASPASTTGITRTSKAAYSGKPTRLIIVEHLNPRNYVEVARNPTEYEQQVETEWHRFAAPGSSYSRLHFSSTKNRVVEMELSWSVNGEESLAQSERARKLLIGWNYPRYLDGWSIGPPKLGLIWPNALPEIRCYLVDCRVRIEAIDGVGHPVRWSATVKFEESSDNYYPSAVRRALDDDLTESAQRLPTSAERDLAALEDAERPRVLLDEVVITGSNEPVILPEVVITSGPVLLPEVQIRGNRGPVVLPEVNITAGSDQ